MGIDTLVDRTNGQVIDQDFLNMYNRVLEGDFVGRDSSGAPTSLQRLGTPLIPWGVTYVTDLVINGQPVDPGLLVARPNRVVSGAVRASSRFPEYLRADGAAASVTILGAVTPLIIDVNGELVEITADTTRTGLTPAPVVNNTCLINDVSLIGQETSKFLGENGTVITVDNMQSELTSLIGEFVTLQNGTTSEFMHCRIASSTELDYVRRGFFFDTAGSPVEAETLLNNDILTLLSTGWIFAENDGVSVDVSYRTPIIGGNEPSAPQTGDYWYDLSECVWKRYSGAAFVQIDRTFIGAAVTDGAFCIAVRPEYFTKSYTDTDTLSVRLQTVDIVEAIKPDFIVSVDGTEQRFSFLPFVWNAATDFESGFTRTIDRNYWLYLTEDGTPKISGYKPYDTRGFLRGWYHPYESWRAVAQVYNDASNEFTIVNASDETLTDTTEKVVHAGRVTLSNNAAVPLTAIDFSGGLFQFDDGTGYAIAPPYSKDLLASWAPGGTEAVPAGGMDGGAVAASRYYYWFAIHNPTTGESDYIAVNPAVSLTSMTRVGGLVTVTTLMNHGYATGDTGVISGVDQLDYNGVPVVTVINATTFTFPITTTPTTPATGADAITLKTGVPAVALPSGYTKKRYIGATWAGAAGLLPFEQAGTYFRFKTRIQNLSRNWFSDPSSGPFVRTVTTPLGLQTKDTIYHVWLNQTGSFKYGFITPPDELIAPTSIYNNAAVGNNVVTTTEFSVYTNRASQFREIYTSYGAGTVSYGTVGYEDLELD